jgi:novobiocin biosynthesis protein NovU/D-mycarose 3-C-methyltransferase
MLLHIILRPLEFLLNCKKNLEIDGLIFIQTSQSDMILNNEFDTIYHEHISFYNIKSMMLLCNELGLNLIDVVKTPIHGTSYIFIISADKSAQQI